MPELTKITGNLAVLLAFLMFVISATLLYHNVPHADSLTTGSMTGVFALMQVRPTGGSK